MILLIVEDKFKTVSTFILFYRNFESLKAQDIRGNCKLAFETGEKLGIPRVIEPADMVLLNVPDKLAVMTYLHQLRAHFTGQEMSLMQLGGNTEESSYSSAQQPDGQQAERSEITLEIISQELKAADEESGRRRRQSSGSGSNQPGVLYRRAERPSPSEDQGHHSASVQAAAAVQLIKDGAKSFTSELLKLKEKVLSPSRDKPTSPSVPESPVRPNQV